MAGPASALVLSRGLAGRFRSAALLGSGCACAEAIYAGLAFWGFSAASARYPWIATASHIVSALVLFALGAAFVRQRPPEVAPPGDHATGQALLQSFALGFSVTIVNPAILATWSASTALLRSAGLVAEPAGAFPFGIGVALGMSAWFGGFAWFLARVGTRFRPSVFARLVQIVGVGLLGLGVFFGWRAVRPWL